MGHPIIPPPDLVRKWQREANHNEPMFPQVAAMAAQWGADQELKACCEWMADETPTNYINALRATRRPSLQNLKQQALQELDKVDMLWATEEFGQETLNSLDTIRRAIESIPDPS